MLDLTARGLRNLGQTCYMSVILQAFLHNPSMRQYFLGDRHNSQLCNREGVCLGCEVDHLFAEVSPTSSQQSFCNLLIIMWTPAVL